MLTVGYPCSQSDTHMVLTVGYPCSQSDSEGCASGRIEIILPDLTMFFEHLTWMFIIEILDVSDCLTFKIKSLHFQLPFFIYVVLGHMNFFLQ